MYGSDQAASVEIGGFAVLVGTIRKIENSIGDGAIRMYEKEIPIALILRAHVPWESSSIE